MLKPRPIAKGAMDGPIEPAPFELAQPDSAIADVARVRAILVASAIAGEPISYSHLLAQLGHRFTRPKMRAVCKTLDAIDAAGAAAGEPELAVLLVRESDGLPLDRRAGAGVRARTAGGDLRLVAGAAPTASLAECPRATSDPPEQRHEYSKYRQADRQTLHDPAHAAIHIIGKHEANKHADVDARRHEGAAFQHGFTIQALRHPAIR
jgi:hypothetical protein